MKKYIVFAGDHYYPSGGWGDKKCMTNSIDVALKTANKKKYDSYAYDWVEILDTGKGMLVYQRCNDTVNLSNI